MKDDTKYITVHIRMNDKEKNTIKKRADLAGKNFSEFIRMSAMGCEIREKADKEFSSTMKKQMRDFIRTLCEVERLLYNKDFIDERILNNDSVAYGDYKLLEQSLDYDITLEKNKNYNEMNIVDVINNITDFSSRIWQIHPFREGNTRTTALL